MGQRKAPSEFAIKRGRLIRRARTEASLSQAQLAQQLGLKSREIVSQYESGAIEQIGERTCVGLVRILGMKPEDLAEDPAVFQFKDELPTMSNEARRVARKWDELPEQMRRWIVETIDGYDSVKGSAAQRARPASRKGTRPKG